MGIFQPIEQQEDSGVDLQIEDGTAQATPLWVLAFNLSNQ
jgi:hypothetical protein